MRFMVIETFKSGKKPLVYERFQEKGRMLPVGLTHIDSWVERDGDRCFQLMETEHEELFKVWTAEWDDLVEFEILPVTSSPVPPSANRETMQTAWFSIAALSKRQREADKLWLEFLDCPTLSMGIYHVAAGTTDRETHDPHNRDEVYIGVNGKGSLTANGEVFDVEAGVIIFVEAGVEHHFHDVTDDLTVLVFFAPNETTDR